MTFPAQRPALDTAGIRIVHSPGSWQYTPNAPVDPVKIAPPCDSDNGGPVAVEPRAEVEWLASQRGIGFFLAPANVLPFVFSSSAGTFPIPQSHVIAAWTSHSTHLSYVFRRHPAWRRIFAGDGKGNYWLALPNEVLERLQ
jgi:hypothetical protein